MTKEILTNKQKVLLYLIDELGRLGRFSRFMVEKSLFLLKKEENIGNSVKFYNFFPYKYGPFSNMSYMDLNNLRSKGYLEGDERHPKLSRKAKEAIKRLDLGIKNKVKRTIERFDSDNDIKEHVYKKYPEYTVKSETPTMKNDKKEPKIFTVGYEGKDIDLFLDLLIKNSIEVIIDVRKNPFSMNFSFTKNKLKNYLDKVKIEYITIPELGIEGSQRKGIDTEEGYKKLFKEYEMQLTKKEKELNKIILSGDKKRIALLCFEENKDMCHRGIIAKYLNSKGIKVEHI